MVIESNFGELRNQCLERAIETFGEFRIAQEWMTSRIPALQNMSPEQSIADNGDASIVLDLLERIDHGIPE
jgi:uncharacterized protein (DUF2384 family)